MIKLVFLIGSLLVLSLSTQNIILAHGNEEHDVISQGTTDTTTNSTDTSPIDNTTQNTTTNTVESSETEISIAPTDELSATDFNLPEPSTWQFFKRRVKRVFTFNQVKKNNIDVELANLTLLLVKKEATAGNTAKSEQLLDKFNQSMEQLSTKVSDLAQSQLSSDQQVAVQDLLTKVQEDRLLQAATVEQLSANPNLQHLQQKALKIKNDTLKDLTKLLRADNPDAEKFNQRLQKISNKLLEKEQKLEKKFVKKLNLIGKIDEEIDEPELEAELEIIENIEVEEITQNNPERIGDIAKEIEGSSEKNLIILETLLERAPEQAKSTLEQVIDRGVERLKIKLQENEDLNFEQTLFQGKRQLESQGRILEKIEKKVDKGQEKFLEKVKQQKEKTQKVKEEKQQVLEQIKLEQIDTEEQKDREEKFDQGEDQDLEDLEERQGEIEDQSSTLPVIQPTTNQTQPTQTTVPTTSTQPTTQPTNGTTPSISIAPSSPTATDDKEEVTETKKVEIENYTFKTTKIEVKKGTKLTINFVNKDQTTHNLSIIGLNNNTTGSVAPGAEKNLSFTVDKDLEFYCSIHPSIPHGKVIVKD